MQYIDIFPFAFTTLGYIGVGAVLCWVLMTHTDIGIKARRIEQAEQALQDAKAVLQSASKIYDEAFKSRENAIAILKEAGEIRDLAVNTQKFAEETYAPNFERAKENG